MKKQERPLFASYIKEIGYPVLLLVWVFLPFILPNYRGFHIFTFPSLYSISASKALFTKLLLTAALSLVLLVSFLKFFSPFVTEKVPGLAKSAQLLSPLSAALASSFIILFFMLHIFRYAASPKYFKVLSPLDYAVFLFSFVTLSSALARVITHLNMRNKTFRDYLLYRRNLKSPKRGFMELLKTSGVQKKLILYFVCLFLVIIIIMSTSLMADFKQTILRTVIFNGNALTERTASIIKANIGDDIAITDYFEIEKKKKESTPYSFNSITFYRRQGKTEEFFAKNSTEEKLVGVRLPDAYKGTAEGISRYNEQLDTYEFLAPVVLSQIIIGYVLVDYDRELMYEPYFRTKIKVISISALFLYLSVFLIYIFGTNIVVPILFLRMGVNKISKTLSGMIRGNINISSDLLRYQDTVHTRDEIKSLSGEIENMTMVIRGIIPYISASTLRHAEKEHPNSQFRELAFLFTDIRGFTSLCEGLEPAQVLEMLNRYLELQSSIIHRNNGDIDKFVGDEIMATFEGPEKELNACRTSMEIRTAMAKEREKRTRENKNAVSVGIGIHAGPVVFGSVGARARMDFTSIGDTVNLAARLEGANKTYGTKALVTETVYKKIKDIYLCREIDFLTVKGKTKPVRIFEILQEQIKASEKLLNLKEDFEKGLRLYRDKKWDSALECFSKLADKLKDEASVVFIQRINLFKINSPPRGWNGVFNLSSK